MKKTKLEYILNKRNKNINGKKKLICSICYYYTSRKRDLFRHFYIHKENKPWCCNICNKRFIRKSSLNVHIEAHKKIIKKRIKWKEYY